MADELANAARILSRAAERLGSRPSTSQQPPCSANNTDTSTSSEMSRLFPHHFQRGGAGSSSNNWRPSTSTKRKRTPAARGTKSKQIIRKFVCLANKDQAETPDAEENRELLLAGLGESKISIAEEATEQEIREVLITTFPKLKEAGGFELMYSEPRKRDLKVITPGANGLNLKFLISFIGQGKVFIRPIQQHLDYSQPVESTKVVLKEKCKRCSLTVDIYSLREHYAVCSKNKGAEDSDSSDTDGDVQLPPANFTSRSKLAQSANFASRSQLAQPSASNEYNSYVSLIAHDEYEDEDPDFLAAIKASLDEHNATDNTDLTGTDSAADILKRFVQQHLHSTDETHVNIVISRKFVYTSTLRAIQRATFSYSKPLTVTFSGEEAVDTGGPKREFLRLLMREIGQSLSKDAFLLLQGISSDKKCLIETLADQDLKVILNDLDNCLTEPEFLNSVAKHCDAIAGYGYSKIYISQFEDKEDIMDSLLKHNYVFSVHAALQQFRDGMNSIGMFGDIVMKNDNVFTAILSNIIDALDFTKFKSLYRVNFSEDGSNRKNDEEKTMYCFEIFLQDLQEQPEGIDGLGFKELLVFITGADSVPPLGFSYPITVEFYDSIAGEQRSPYSSTCSLTIYLPRGIGKPEAFSALIKQSLLECHGFGKV